MKKKITALFLAVVMCMTLCIPAFADVSAEENTVQVELVDPPQADEATQLIIDQQKPAVNAYQELMVNIESVENGRYTYPNSYGGAYIDDSNKLCVTLTDSSEETIAQYKTYFSNPSVVYFQEVENSYNELSDTMYMVLDSIEEFSGMYVDEEANVVKVGTSSSVSPATYNFCDLPVEWYYEEPAPSAVSIIGGDAVTANGSRYTVGICGTYYDGRDAVLLCGHGVEIGEYLTLSGSSSPFARVIAKRFENNVFYDYAVAVISDTSVTMTNKVYNATGGTTTITDYTVARTPVNTVVCKYGSTTKFGTGEVVSNNYAWTDSKSGITVLATTKCTNLNGSYVDGGDSGGPVYIGHEFHGTISAGSPTIDYFVFSPISGVFSNFYPKTS